MSQFNKDNISKELPTREKVPLTEQYIFFTSHLQYLDGKMTDLFKHFITLATAIIGGTFLICLKSTPKDTNYPLLAFGADLLLITVGFSISFCILNRLRSWGGYRKRLVQLYDTGEVATRPLSGEWWVSEALICLIIMATAGAFPYINPLATANTVPHLHCVQWIFGICCALLAIYLFWILHRLTSKK